MHKLANTYADKCKPKFGDATVKPVIGETFDVNNDLYLYDACTVHHRDGHVTHGSPTSVHSDALIEYNRRHLSAELFHDHYGDGDEEYGMLHGCN